MTPHLDSRSIYLRSLIVRAMIAGDRGHLGSAASIVEILRVLFDDYLKFSSADPNWGKRDRFILSKGHGCLALYALLADKKFFPMSELDKFCSSTGILGGHPESNRIPGVEASTGALGHGLPIGVGMALAAEIRNEDYRVVVLTGDGEINEGSTWEAAMSASKHRLNRLSVLVDYNKYQSYDKTEEVLALEPLTDKWRSFGFCVREVDGHDVDSLRQCVGKLPFEDEKPNLIICHTEKGKGFPFAEGNLDWHHKSRFSKDEIDNLYAAVDLAV